MASVSASPEEKTCLSVGGSSSHSSQMSCIWLGVRQSTYDARDVPRYRTSWTTSTLYALGVMSSVRPIVSGMCQYQIQKRFIAARVPKALMGVW